MAERKTIVYPNPEDDSRFFVVVGERFQFDQVGVAFIRVQVVDVGERVEGVRLAAHRTRRDVGHERHGGRTVD